MSSTFLEHANITVKDLESSAALLCRLFDWKIRWQGDSMENGKSIHVGSDQSYIALYTQPSAEPVSIDSYSSVSALNHIGLVVEDLELIEQRLANEGLEITSRADYDPGRRIYFHTPEGIEIEAVCYQ